MASCHAILGENGECSKTPEKYNFEDKPEQKKLKYVKFAILNGCIAYHFHYLYNDIYINIFILNWAWNDPLRWVNTRPLSVFRHLRQWRGGGGDWCYSRASRNWAPSDLWEKKTLYRSREVLQIDSAFFNVGQYLTQLWEVKNHFFARSEMFQSYKSISEKINRSETKLSPAFSPLILNGLTSYFGICTNYL